MTKNANPQKNIKKSPQKPNKKRQIKIAVPENLGCVANDDTFAPLDDALYQICKAACETPVEASLLLEDYKQTIIQNFLETIDLENLKPLK